MSFFLYYLNCRCHILFLSCSISFHGSAINILLLSVFIFTTFIFDQIQLFFVFQIFYYKIFKLQIYMLQRENINYAVFPFNVNGPSHFQSLHQIHFLRVNNKGEMLSVNSNLISQFRSHRSPKFQMLTYLSYEIMSSLEVGISFLFSTHQQKTILNKILSIMPWY